MYLDDFIINNTRVIFYLSHKNGPLSKGRLGGSEDKAQALESDGSLLTIIGYINLGKLPNIFEASIFSFGR